MNISIERVHCWKCGSSNCFSSKMRVGRERVSQKDIKEGCKDVNIYTTFWVCKDCGYRFTPAQNLYLKKIVFNTERNNKIVTLAARFATAKQPTLIYINLIEHGNLLQIAIREQFNKCGIKPELCVFVNGALDDAFNEDAKKKFKSKQLLTVICTSIWGEGTDVPSLRWVVYAKAGKPGIELEQVLGRSLRRDTGKWRAGFVDFQDEFDKTFATRSRARKRFLVQKGFTPRTLTQVISSRRFPRFLVEK